MALVHCLSISPPISPPVSYRKQRDVFNNVTVPARRISPPGPFDAKVCELGRDGPPHAFLRRDRQQLLVLRPLQNNWLGLGIGIKGYGYTDIGMDTV